MNLSVANKIARKAGLEIKLNRDSMKWEIGLPCTSKAQFDCVAFGKLTEKKLLTVCRKISREKLQFS